MFWSKNLNTLLIIALLMSSAMLLSGCQCSQAKDGCISATYTPLPPTPWPPLAPDAPPSAVVDRFAALYSAADSNMSGIEQLFDAAVTGAGGAQISCALRSTRSSYGPFSSYSTARATNNQTTALVVENTTSPSGIQTFSFTLHKEAVGWRIDSVAGWPGGDITSADPVGGIQSCLASAPSTN